MRLKGFQKLTQVDDALQKFLHKMQIHPLKAIRVPLNLSLNRILAEEVVAETDLPRFDRSAVDGYAVKAEETEGSTQFAPAIFQLTDKDSLGNKKAKQVWTGNRLPQKADAVVMLEDTKREGFELQVWTPVTPGENVSKRGEDVSKGEIAVKSRTRLKPHHLGLIAALGKTEVEVFEKPKIGILATGNELAETGSPLGPDQVFEMNRLVLSALCIEMGAQPVDLGIAKDNVKEILAKIEKGLKETDAVTTSGGTSVGGSDLVPDAVNKAGKPGVVVHGVAMRPAMPTALAVVGNKPIVILPGNPVAAMFGFEVFVRPLIGKMLGLRKAEQRFTVKAKTTRAISTTLGRRTYARVHVSQKDSELFAEPISTRGSSMISTMTKANGYVIVPENKEGLEKGETVTVHMFETIDAVGDS